MNDFDRAYTDQAPPVTKEKEVNEVLGILSNELNELHLQLDELDDATQTARIPAEPPEAQKDTRSRMTGLGAIVQDRIDSVRLAREKVRRMHDTLQI